MRDKSDEMLDAAEVIARSLRLLLGPTFPVLQTWETTTVTVTVGVHEYLRVNRQNSNTVQVVRFPMARLFTIDKDHWQQDPEQVLELIIQWLEEKR